MALGDIASLAALVGVGLAIWLGRRKGRNRFAAAVATARAEGHAEAKVELAASLANVVNVQVGSDRPGTGQVATDDLFLAVLRDAERSAVHRAGPLHDIELSPGHDEYHDLYDSSTRALGHRTADAGEQFTHFGPARRWDRRIDGPRVADSPPPMNGRRTL